MVLTATVDMEIGLTELYSEDASDLKEISSNLSPHIDTISKFMTQKVVIGHPLMTYIRLYLSFDLLLTIAHRNHLTPKLKAIFDVLDRYKTIKKMIDKKDITKVTLPAGGQHRRLIVNAQPNMVEQAKNGSDSFKDRPRLLVDPKEPKRYQLLMPDKSIETFNDKSSVVKRLKDLKESDANQYNSLDIVYVSELGSCGQDFEFATDGQDSKNLPDLIVCTGSLEGNDPQYFDLEKLHQGIGRWRGYSKDPAVQPKSISIAVPSDAQTADVTDTSSYLTQHIENGLWQSHSYLQTLINWKVNYRPALVANNVTY